MHLSQGGTSTDVSRYGGQLEHVFETTTAGVTIQSPQLDISTVAAGGGSMLFFRNGMFVVGPESAGSNPGPACYRKGGPLTVTDANLFLGRLHIDSFPKSGSTFFLRSRSHDGVSTICTCLNAFAQFSERKRINL